MVYPTGFQEVITIDKHKETFRLLFSQALVEKMCVMPRLIKENGKVDFDMIYPTGFQDMITNDKPKVTFSLFIFTACVECGRSQGATSSCKTKCAQTCPIPQASKM